MNVIFASLQVGAVSNAALTHQFALFMFCRCKQGSKLKEMSRRKFATSYENLVATLKMLVAKLIEAI